MPLIKGYILAATDTKMRISGIGARQFFIWMGVAVGAVALCWFLRGDEGVENGTINYANQMLFLLPRLVAGLLVSGFTQILVPRSVIASWLGDKSGFKGILVATAVGAVSPGGPMVAFPLVLVLRNGGASAASLIAFMTAWVTLSFHRVITWEISLMGPEIATVRYLSSISLAIIAGLLAAPLARAIGYTTRSVE